MTKTMPQSAANDNHGEFEGLWAEAHRAFRELVQAVAGPDADFARRERVGLEVGNELCRADQEQELRRISSTLVARELMIDGVLHRRHSKKMAGMVFHGLCGDLKVPRALYRKAGSGSGPTTGPLERVAGLMEKATPAMGYAVNHGYARGPSRHAHQAMVAHGRRPPSRSTTERMAKGLGAKMEEALPVIEPVIRATEEVPTAAMAISLGLDRTSVPMEEPAGPDKPPVIRKVPRVRKTPDPVEVNYRMAYVGTFSIVDADGRSVFTKRYGVAGDVDPAPLLERLQADLEHALGQRPDLPVGLVQDGAPEMWNLMRGMLDQTPKVDRWSEAIDRHHLSERLAGAMRAAGLTEAWRDEQLAKWNASFDDDDGTIDRVEEYLQSLTVGLVGTPRADLDDHLTYIANNKDRMRYASVRRQGLPVGSGATEGACKSLVMIRAKACGQRWRDDGIDALLTLRGLLLSDRLQQATELLRRQHSATVKLVA